MPEENGAIHAAGVCGYVIRASIMQHKPQRHVGIIRRQLLSQRVLTKVLNSITNVLDNAE